MQTNTYGRNTFFIDGPGGTGKTFVYKLILAKIRSSKNIALAVASSGIAAQLMPGGRTAHSRLKIPFNLNAQSTCYINLQSETATLIQHTRLILWDECPMMHRYAFEALDRTLRDVMSAVNPKFKHIPFGNVVIVFGGDFRQILPVVKKGTRCDIVNAAFNRSLLWLNVNVLKLTINMRVQSLAGENQQAATEFSEYLLRIGEGKEQTFR
jgi:ATP-dependent DNA helicase PIF1